MRVMIIGGTGLLGYHAVRELLKRGHMVDILALPPLPASGLFPGEVKIQLGDLEVFPDGEPRKHLRGHDAVIFAAGVDDRVTPKTPAYPFFRRHNVESTHRLAELARQSGVQRFIILGSYFAYFHRIWPHLELTRYHPYIRSRVEQTAAAQAAGGAQMAVITLELPYIFGVMPGRTPLWKPLVRYAASGFPLFYPSGGTTCVSVTQVAQAIAGALERGEPGACYPIGGENLTWSELLSRITRFAGREKKTITLPTWLVKAGARLFKLWHSLKGMESGLNPVRFIDLQTACTFIDPALSSGALGYKLGALDEVLIATVEFCLNKKDPARGS